MVAKCLKSVQIRGLGAQGARVSDFSDASGLWVLDAQDYLLSTLKTKNTNVSKMHPKTGNLKNAS